MRQLIAAEFQKLATTRLWLWLMILSMVLTGLYVALSIQYANNPDLPEPALSSAAGLRTVLAIGSTSAAAMLAVLAAIGVAGEFRHKTATGVFLATPRRSRVMLAKMAVYPVVGVGYAVASTAVALALGLPWLAAKHIHVSLAGDGLPGAFAGVIITVALFGVFGAGVGALLRDQVAAVIALLLYLILVEDILDRLPGMETAARYLPGIAARALSQVHQTKVHFLAPWQGGLVLAGYCLVLAVAGTIVIVRRDVT
jgi:ABC-2 type transport system permease protein